MKVQFHHLSIMAQDPEGMKNFLCQLLNLESGKRPDFNFDGCFLYADEKDVIHIMSAPSIGTERSGIDNRPLVDHFCFSTDSLKAATDRIIDMGLQYSVSAIPGANLRQVFVRGPEHILIEIQGGAGT